MAKDLPIRDQALSYLTVEGWSNEEIAELFKIEPDSVRLKLTDEKIQDKVRQLAYKLLSEDPKKRFEDILPYAIDTIEAILKDPSVKPQLKISAAQDAIDRVMGKAKQTIEHEGSLVRAMLERLNAPPPPAAIPVEFQELVSDNRANPNESQPLSVSKNPNFQEDPVDSWIAQNLK